MRSGGELAVPSVLGERMEDEFHAFDEDVGLLPHVIVPFGTISTLGSRPWFSNL
jgi:hypothetical protein